MDLVSTPENPVPRGAVSGHIRCRDDIRLRYARWPAPIDHARGTVCILHGRTEFIEKYFEVILDLLQRGFAVATVDWRGQGGSDRPLKDPTKGHVDDFRSYERDLQTFFQAIVLPDCPPPYYALAHSTGAAVVLQAAPHLRTRIDRMVLTAPLLRLEKLKEHHDALRILISTLDSLGFNKQRILSAEGRMAYASRFENNIVTSDRTRFERTRAIIEAAPQLAIGAPTIGWLHAAIEATDRLMDPRFAPRMRIPALLIASGADKVVSTTAIEAFSARVNAAGHVIIPGARHEIMMERDDLRDQFWAAFDAFIPGTGNGAA